MQKLFLSLIVIYFFSIEAYLTAQVNLTSSHLPIMIINTNGKTIQDEPKVVVDMKLIYNGEGVINNINDIPSQYNGKIGIEFRGSTSQTFPKKPYGFETIDANGENNNVSLLGMPEENDWVLNATYNDKSLMRDGLTYILGGKIMKYSPRVRYIELVVDGEYRGVYLLMEKIKRDKNRVNIKDLKRTDIDIDKISGGYILKIDKETGSNSGEGWISDIPPIPGGWQRTFFQLEFPKADDINNAQYDYIKKHITTVENVILGNNFKDPVNGYRKYIDTSSLIDFIIMNELTKNPDAYRISTFFHKDRDSEGGKINFGPIWDFNLGLGNVDYCTNGHAQGLVINTFNQVCPGDGWVIHFWWNRFLQDPVLYKSLKIRWSQLRNGAFSNDNIQNTLDSLRQNIGNAHVRNFQRWPILGTYIWPNYYVGNTYQEEVTFLKNWIDDRLDYLDQVWKIDISSSIDIMTTDVKILPNPVNDIVLIETTFEAKTITITDMSGREAKQPVKSATNKKGYELDMSTFTPGHYIIQLQNETKTVVSRIIKN